MHKRVIFAKLTSSNGIMLSILSIVLTELYHTPCSCTVHVPRYTNFQLHKSHNSNLWPFSRGNYALAADSKYIDRLQLVRPMMMHI